LNRLALSLADVVGLSILTFGRLCRSVFDEILNNPSSFIKLGVGDEDCQR
jgi:hypothetical protein